MHRAVHRLSSCLAVLPCVAACVPPPWGLRDVATPGAAYDFNWRLSGERAVAPLQVFDDGRRTWLHFAPRQALPAIFALGHDGERPVSYVRRDPYVVIEGIWPALIMRGGRLRAVARRQAVTAFDADPRPGDAAEGALPGHAPDTEGPAPLRDFAVGDNGPMALPEPATGITGSAPVPPQSAALAAKTGTSRGARTRPGTGLPPRSRQVAELGSTGNLAFPGNPGGPQAGRGHVAATPVFRAELADGNLRGVLARWASLAGWTFGPEHWDVDVDIPLVGAAGFGDDFKHAVRGLVGATEMAERPLQPCFYVNRVLRVVPLAQACDRSAPREAAT